MTTPSVKKKSSNFKDESKKEKSNSKDESGLTPLP